MVSLNKLTKEQLAVVESLESKILVNAGVGSGKTTCIAAAAKYRNKYGKNLALITFTNEAANEIDNRINFTPYYLGTIHKFALKLLNEMSEKYGFKLHFIKTEFIKKIIYNIFVEEKIPLIYLEDCADYCINSSEYAATNSVVPRWYNHIRKKYINYKRKTNSYDFTDSPQYLVEKLKYYKDYTPNIHYLLVDEGQDLSITEYELIKLLNIQNKIIVMDPKQSIYMWRDSDAAIYTKFILDGYKEYKLTLCYRSYQEILDYVHNGMTSIKGSGGIVNMDLVECLKLHPMVLCRTNKQVADISKYYDNVMTIHAAKGLEWDSVIVISDIKKWSNINTIEEHNIRYVGITRAKQYVCDTTLDELLNCFKRGEYGR